MQSFRRQKGVAAPLVRDNIDTDAIIPSREIVAVDMKDLGIRLFSNWRYIDRNRSENPEFILNRSPYRSAKFLISGQNFGCGSSREAAVWALQQFGITAVIAESFGAIFRANCIRNGLLPILLSNPEITKLAGWIGESGASNEVLVDLESQTIEVPFGGHFRFSLSTKEREMLLDGLDMTDLLLADAAALHRFDSADKCERPWIYQVSP